MQPTAKKSGRGRCLVCSRGGHMTKVHAGVDGHGLPIAIKLTDGQVSDGKSGEDMLEALLLDCILLADRG